MGNEIVKYFSIDPTIIVNGLNLTNVSVILGRFTDCELKNWLLKFGIKFVFTNNFNFEQCLRRPLVLVFGIFSSDFQDHIANQFIVKTNQSFDHSSDGIYLKTIFVFVRKFVNNVAYKKIVKSK